MLKRTIRQVWFGLIWVQCGQIHAAIESNANSLFFYVGLFEHGELSRLKMFGLTPSFPDDLVWSGMESANLVHFDKYAQFDTFFNFTFLKSLFCTSVDQALGLAGTV